MRYNLMPLLALLSGSCSSDVCREGQPCECTGGNDCFLECRMHDCEIDCHNTATTCGTSCTESCSSSCHDTSRCDQSCDHDCELSCNNTAECHGEVAGTAGIECHDTTTCAYRVGPGSSVDCHHAASCAVACTGTCHVTYHDLGGNTVQLTCEDDGAPASDCGDGKKACGDCGQF